MFQTRGFIHRKTVYLQVCYSVFSTHHYKQSCRQKSVLYYIYICLYFFRIIAHTNLLIQVGKNIEHQIDATITVLLITKISSTCFGQTFAHLQERKTEIFFTTYGMKVAVSLASQWNLHTIQCQQQHSETLPATSTGHYTIRRKKNLSLALLKMGKSLPETCWADLGDQ
jgi:hypothetical protein